MHVSLGEKIGLAVMFSGIPFAAFVGWWATAFLVIGAAVLFTSQHVNYKRTREALGRERDRAY